MQAKVRKATYKNNMLMAHFQTITNIGRMKLIRALRIPEQRISRRFHTNQSRLSKKKEVLCMHRQNLSMTAFSMQLSPSNVKIARKENQQLKFLSNLKLWPSDQKYPLPNHRDCVLDTVLSHIKGAKTLQGKF
jgi:hypothetical protein